MPRFFLHLRTDVSEVLDEEGLELADVTALIGAMLAGARDIMAGELTSDGFIDLRYRIDAEDEQGHLIHSLPFREAFAILEPPAPTTQAVR